MCSLQLPDSWREAYTASYALGIGRTFQTPSYADGDCELARTLKLKDRELDALTRDISEKLVERATVDSELVPSYLDLIFVARALERIGDHATNIAEGSFWRDQAADIRHTYGPNKEV